MADWQGLIDGCRREIDRLNSDADARTQKRDDMEQLKAEYNVLYHEFVSCYEGAYGERGKKQAAVELRDGDSNVTAEYNGAVWLMEYISGEENYGRRDYIQDAIAYLTHQIQIETQEIEQDYRDISSNESDIAYYEEMQAQEEEDDDDDREEFPREEDD